MSRISSAAAAAFVLLLAPSLLLAGTHSVAVLPFENVAKDPQLDWLSAGIPETITNDLLAIKDLVLVERVQLRKVMDEQKLQSTEAVDQKTAVKVGKLVGAGILVVGGFQKQAETIRLTARFVDAESGGVLQTAKVTGNMKDIFDLQDQIVKELAKNLNIELKQEELAQLSVKPTESLEAYKHFGQGALLQERKDFQGAVTEFQKATKIDPTFSLAKNKFAEAFLSLNKNNYWIYEEHSELLRATNTTRAGGVEEFGGKRAFTYIEEGGTDNERETRTTYHYLKGSDGVYTLGQDRIGLANNGARTHMRITYDPPLLQYPYQLAVGMKWSAESKMMVTIEIELKPGAAKSEDGWESSLKAQSVITKKEALEIPGLGNVDCFVLDSEVAVGASKRAPASVVVMSSCFAPGIGLVRQTFTAEVKKGSPSVRDVKTLTGYHLDE